MTFSSEVVQYVFIGILFFCLHHLEKRVDKLEEVLRRIRRF